MSYQGRDQAARLGEDIPLILQPAVQRDATVNAMANGGVTAAAGTATKSLLMYAAVAAVIAFALTSKSMKRGLSWR